MGRGFAIVLLWFLAGHSGAAETLLTNATIYTVDPERPLAEAVLIDDTGVIRGVGEEAPLRARAPDAQIIDLGGRMVLPGFQDVHVHAIEAGINETLCVFEAFDTLAGYRAALQDCALDWDGLPWVLGANVNMAHLLRLSDDPLALIDAAIPDRPALILDDIGHGAWANSLALTQADFMTPRPDAPGDIILRQSDGRPKGVVLENAPNRLRNLAFPDNPGNLEHAYEGLLKAIETFNAYGITTISDAGGYWPQGHIKVWQRAQDAGRLSVRAANALYIYPHSPIEGQLPKLKSMFRDGPEQLLRFNQAKIYVDGILSQGTGAVLTPYRTEASSDQLSSDGHLYFAPKTLFHIAQTLVDEGFQLHFHVTGDRAARLALDVIERLEGASGPHRLTHLYLVDPDDYHRFAELGVFADFQLAPSALTPEYEAFIAEFIGERAKALMPAGALLEAGAPVVLSSDWDADELNPMVKIAAVLTRPQNGFPDIASAIKAMTLRPAELLLHADKTGSITPGKWADLAIVSRNILELAPKEIARTLIDATLFQSKPVYDPRGLFSISEQ